MPTRILLAAVFIANNVGRIVQFLFKLVCLNTLMSADIVAYLFVL